MAFSIQVFVNNSIRISTDMGAVYVDPFKMANEPHDAAVVLITHPHYDHMSPKDIEKVSCDKTILIVPESAKNKAHTFASCVGEIRTMKAGGSMQIDTLKVEAVPAYNIFKLFHLKIYGWLGYIITVEGKRIYVAGDIDAIKEARAVKCDIAMVPIGGFYTMNPRQAAALINEIKPEIAIPTHYGSVIGKPEDAETFKALVKEPTRVETATTVPVTVNKL